MQSGRNILAGVALAVGLMGTAMAADAEPPWSPEAVSVFEESKGKYAFGNDYGVPFFTNDRDKDGKIGCGDECVGITWLPVYARETAKPQGNWSIVLRPDKAAQWAYKGKPVYNYFASQDRDEVRTIAKEDGHWIALEP